MQVQQLWKTCTERLEKQLPEAAFNGAILPLRVELKDEELFLCAPNVYVFEQVQAEFLQDIRLILQHLNPALEKIRLIIGTPQEQTTDTMPSSSAEKAPAGPPIEDNLNPRYLFANFVQGKSNELAFNASWSVANSPGGDFNPLFLYGSTGLGKTHLLHAIGHQIRQNKPDARIVYLSSEHFVQLMIRALQSKTIDQFKQQYRNVDCLLVDDIQFLAGKERSQEEFFYTFNALLESQQQIVLTCDRFPKDMENVEDRLLSRFGWGLSVAVEPPDFETRVAILQTKAASSNMELPADVAFFIAKHIRSHVRDLEGALNTLIANVRFTQRPLTVDYTREILRDMLSVQQRQLTIENIQRKVADYYKIKISDLGSQSRKRNITRPRQVAMWLCKELTNRSLPEIGAAFGGRDHTTVLHACRKIEELCSQDTQMEEDRNNLLRILTT